MTRLIILFCFFVGVCASLSAQTFYYIRNESNFNQPQFGNWFLNCFNVNTCEDTTLTQIDSTGFGFPLVVSDLAICPNGNFYVSLQLTSSGCHIAELDPITGQMTILSTLPSTIPLSFITALVSGESNILYGSGSNKFYSYDVDNNLMTDHGVLNIDPIRDLTFRDGRIWSVTPNTPYEIFLNPITSAPVNTMYPYSLFRAVIRYSGWI